MDAARSVSDGVVLVVPGDAASGEPGCGPAIESIGADVVVAGGRSRAESVRAGLAAVPDEAVIIVVHDAARPLAGAPMFAAVVEAVRDGAEGAVPVLPVTDTLKRASGGTVRSTVDRDGLVAVQTPQAFVASTLRAAHRTADEATDDAALLERLGAAVCTVSGDPRNVKLTRPEDLEVAEVLAGGPPG